MVQGESPPLEQTALEPPVPPVPARRWHAALRHFLAALLCAALFAATLWLYTRNNTFPVEFHPDEPGKVRQIMQGTRNFYHPQLLLEATQLWLDYKDVPKTDDSVILAGREVAAFFGAAAVTMFALTAYLTAGWWALIAAAILFGCSPLILTYSHYMKEDTALLVGVAMAVLASRIIWMTPRWYVRIPAWALIAAGVALATSGKYVGAMTIALPITLAFLAPGVLFAKPRWYTRLPVILPVAIGIVIAVYTGEAAAAVISALISLALIAPALRFPGRWYSIAPAIVLMAAGIFYFLTGGNPGAAFIPVAVGFSAMVPRYNWLRPVGRILLFVPLILYFAAIINHRTLNTEGLDFAHVAAHPTEWRVLFNPQFLRGLEFEAEHSKGSHWGLTAARPNSYTIRTAFQQSWPHAIIPAILLPVAILLTWRRGWGYETMLVLFAALCAYVLSHSIILFPRYPMPVTALLHLLAAIALGRLLWGLRARPVTQATLGAIAACVLLATLVPVCADYTHQFANDSRFALQKWASENLPRNARVYSDFYARLQLPGGEFERTRRDVNNRVHFILPLMPGFEYQAGRTEAYYIICDLAYNRYFEPSAVPAKGSEASSEYARSFYDKLLNHHAPVWVAASSRNMYAFTNPEIRVYKLSPEEFRKEPTLPQRR